MAQTAKLFMNGRSQAVRLPKEFRFEGKEVLIRRDPATGDVVLTTAAQARQARSFEAWIKRYEELAAEGPKALEQLPPAPGNLTPGQLVRLTACARVPATFMAERATSKPRDLDLF